MDDDHIYGAIGADILSGGSGNDTIDGGSEDDNIDGGSGNDSIDAGSGNDTITGGEGDDVLHGNDGDDTITAGLGADTITGGQGTDAIDGSDGDDTITAGLGADTITGGAGRDQFIFTYEDFLDDYVDVITDFEVGATGDLLDLSNLHAKSITENGGNTLGQEIYPYSLGYIRFIKSDDDTIVAYDVDGHAIDHLPKAFALLKDTNPLDLAVENLSVEGMNFGISEMGLSAIYL